MSDQLLSLSPREIYTLELALLCMEHFLVEESMDEEENIREINDLLSKLRTAPLAEVADSFDDTL